MLPPEISWGEAATAVLIGVYGLFKFMEHRAKQDVLRGEADMGNESSRHLVRRAEERMKELHDLRNETNKILGDFGLRLVKVESDVKHMEATLRNVENTIEKNNKLLTAILLRVSALGGGRRSAPGDPEDDIPENG